MNAKQREQQEAREHLLRIIKPGDTVYTFLLHVSRSGMYRVINLHIIKDNVPININYWAAKLLQGYDDRHDGCKATGCGMDMGFALVHSLSYALFPDGYDCIGKDEEAYKFCPSNDHSNGDRDYTPHHHSSGGYALRHCWM